MPICKFFSSTSGCLRGDRCYYQHVNPPSQKDLDSTTILPTSMPSRNLNPGSPLRPAKLPLPGSPDPVAGVSCRFFNMGTCKNGDNCRFLHNGAGEDEAAPESIPPQARFQSHNIDVWLTPTACPRSTASKGYRAKCERPRGSSRPIRPWW